MMSKKEISIQNLALDFLEKRNNKTFTILIRRLKPGLNSFIYQYVKDSDLTKEIVSKTFIAVWEKLDQYNKDFNFSTWVYAIAKNEALGQIRSRSKTISREHLDENHSKLLKIYTPMVQLNLEVIGPSGENLKIYLYDKIIEVINCLEEPYRTVLVEREINKQKIDSNGEIKYINKSLQDIAIDLGWNLNTVKTRLRKARKDVAEVLKEKHSDLIEAYYEETEE
jgi:RNA polymerase sigma factor (sigma-70 family)